MLRVARVLASTTAEGPGSRTAVWVQGCSIRCAGCINPQLFTTRGGSLLEPQQIIDAAVAAGDEGLTVLGGEPFDQAEEVGRLAEMAQGAGLGVITFTGFLREHLEREPAAHRLLDNTDLLVDGPFERDRPESKRSLVGSTNQRFHQLTGRYHQFDPHRHRNRVDVRLSRNGLMEVAGFLDQMDADELLGLLDVRRVRRITPSS